MGIFDRLFSKKAKAPQQRIVTVAFRDLTARDPLNNFSLAHGYAYIWPFPDPPKVGDWAVAPGIDGPASVIVGSLQMHSSARGLELMTLIRPISPEEVLRANADRNRAIEQWLDHALAALGSGTVKPTRKQAPPPGFDPLPPIDGKANVADADTYGKGWWRLYNTAEELGRPPAEVAALKQAGQRWFKLRDKAVTDERDRRMAKALASTDLESAIRNVHARTRKDVMNSRFAGQPLADWLPHAQELESDGRTDEALNLVYALITAAEQEAALSGREPAPAYTERAAIIHRKHKDYAAEIAVIERWDHACPPKRRGPGATQAKLLKRLDRAKELAAKA